MTADLKILNFCCKIQTEESEFGVNMKTLIHPAFY